MTRIGLTILLAATAAAPALAAETTLTSALTGQGSGTASFKVDPEKGQVCYTLEVKDVGNAVAAHIHKGAAGANGPPAVGLDSPGSGKAEGCKTVSAEVANALIADPAGYYVNVHTAAAPGGAIRGQLSK